MANAGQDGVARTDTISIVLSAVPVVAGPPHSIDLDIRNEGEDAGGGTWQIPVSARVWDVHRNPVADRIPVVFTVDPEIATIDPGFTGNDIGQGSTSGIAYSWLRYHSFNTGDSVTITAEVQVPDGILTAERSLILPLQQGVLSLEVDPQNWMFDRARPNDTCTIMVTATLIDGHQIMVSGLPILFRSDRARFYWRDSIDDPFTPYFPDPARRIVEHGSARVYLRGIMSDFFLDDFSLETTPHVESSVEGYEVASDPAFIFVTRH